MKKIVLLLLAIPILFSCSVKYPYKEYYSFFDYSEHIKKGFFITESNSVNFDYTPIGTVSFIMRSGYEEIEKRDSSIYGEYKDIDVEKAITSIVNIAKMKNANGIINLKVEFVPAVFEKRKNVILGNGVIISGMAIKR